MFCWKQQKIKIKWGRGFSATPLVKALNFEKMLPICGERGILILFSDKNRIVYFIGETLLFLIQISIKNQYQVIKYDEYYAMVSATGFRRGD